MRFYYLSFVSAGIIAGIYRLGTGALLWIWSRLRWGDPGVWKVMLPLFFLLYVTPVAEEFWIAWKFSDLCRNQAGTHSGVVNSGAVNSGAATSVDESGHGDLVQRIAISSAAHKIIRSERRIISNESGEVIRSVTDFQRQPPWFALDPEAPAMSCTDQAHSNTL